MIPEILTRKKLIYFGYLIFLFLNIIEFGEYEWSKAMRQGKIRYLTFTTSKIGYCQIVYFKMRF